jgi:hypothetical protein
MAAAPTAAIAIAADATGRDRIVLTVISLMPAPPAPDGRCPHRPSPHITMRRRQ